MCIPTNNFETVVPMSVTLFWLAGGVGFDINCGVRLVRTNLFEKDVQPIKEQLAQVGCVEGAHTCDDDLG